LRIDGGRRGNIRFVDSANASKTGRERATHAETRGVRRTTYGGHDVLHTLRVRCLTSGAADIGSLVMNKGEMGGPLALLLHPGDSEGRGEG